MCSSDLWLAVVVDERVRCAVRGSWVVSWSAARDDRGVCDEAWRAGAADADMFVEIACEGATVMVL